MTDPSSPTTPDTAPADGGTRPTIADLPRQAIGSARQAASETAHRTADMIEQNPLSVLVGGLVVGVLAGAAIPKGAQETKLLKPVGKRLTQGAGLAAKAAREAGLSELAAAGISRDAARDQARKLIGSVLDAAKSAGDAARRAARSPHEPATASDFKSADLGDMGSATVNEDQSS